MIATKSTVSYRIEWYWHGRKYICYDNDVSISALCVCVCEGEWCVIVFRFQKFSVSVFVVLVGGEVVEGSYRRGKATKAVVGVPYKFPSASVHKPPRRSFLR